MARTEIEIKKDLKTEWGVLKTTKDVESKKPIWARINVLEKEAGFKVTDFVANQKAFEANRASGGAKSAEVPFTPIKEFKVLDKNEQDATEEQARRLFEKKNIVERVAHDEFPQYCNGASVGQVLGIISAP